MDADRVEQDPDAPVALVDEPLYAGAGTAPVVQQHGVGDESARRPVEEDHGNAHLDLGAQVRVVVAGRHDEQTIDPA